LSIRRKTLVTLVFSLVALVSVLYGVLSAVVTAGFGTVERRDAMVNMQRVTEAWGRSLQALEMKLGDWASWDDTYAYVVDQNEHYASANLVGAPFESMKIDMMLLFDPQGRPVKMMGWDRTAHREVPIPENLVAAHFSPDSPNILFKTTNAMREGVVLTRGLPPLLFCSKPILTSNGDGPIRGAMVFASWFDAERQQSLQQLTRLSLRFHANTDESTPRDVASVLPGMRADGAVVVQPASERIMAGYTSITDVYGQPAMVICADLPRDIHQQAAATLNWILLALIGVGVAFCGIIVLLLERVVLRRLSRLSATVSGITDSFDFSRRIEISGDDEISRLGRSVNGLVAACEQVMDVGMQTAGDASAIDSEEDVEPRLRVVGGEEV
jgi:sensor domain CHASE-containing protein